MDWLRVEHDQIVNEAGRPVRLRGVCVGGWMNMEAFINGFPGVEQGLRAALDEALGPGEARAFMDHWLDCFFAEADAAYLASLGANVVRLPLNYRHFERDEAPFQYLEAGFERLARAVEWCGRHGLYVILDLHAAPGWQNPDWHSDNPTQHALLWQHRQCQDRAIGLWQALARRFARNPVVAGYDLLNEPVTGAASEVYGGRYRTDWAALNGFYARAVKAIRAIDPDHILFLEGDAFATRFGGLEPPAALGPNIACSAHVYNRAGWGPGAYPGTHKDGDWHRERLHRDFDSSEAAQFARQHGVPLWIGEFGSVYNGPPEDRPSRLRGLDDQIGVFEAHGAHWTAWTYKDVGVMGMLFVDPASPFMRRTAPVQQAKAALHADAWMYWLPSTPAKEVAGQLALMIYDTVGDAAREAGWVRGQVFKAALAGTASALLQPVFARLVAALSPAERRALCESFAFEHCRPNPGVAEIYARHWRAAA